MSRGLAAANAAAALLSHVRPLVFLEIQFDSGTLYLHNAVGTYTWGGHTWTGVGALGEVAPYEESDDPSPYRISYRLNGLNATILAEALDEEVYKRLIIRYDGFIGDDGNLVADPDEIRRDYGDTMEIVRGDDMESVILNCESEHIRDTQAPGGLFSDEDQQALFAGDTGFQYLAQTLDAQPYWGPGGIRVMFGGGEWQPGDPLPPGVHNNPYVR